MSLNGDRPEQQEGEPAIIVPAHVEAAQLLTRSFKVPLGDEGSATIVTMLINAPGRGIALNLLAEDAIAWGEKLIREAKAGQSKLIL